MPNSAFLLNTPTRVSDISAIRGQWLVVAEVPYRIPLAWLCMFDASDLRPCTLTFSNPQVINGEQRYLLGKYSFLNPSTSVRDARERLARSRPVFEILAGDAETGTQYWREAMAALETLPLGFLTIDATEVLLLDDVKASTEALAAAVGFGAPSMEAKKRLARFNPQVGVELNRAALAAAILPVDAFQRWERSPEEARAWLDLLAQLDTCNLLQTDTGYDAIPLAQPLAPVTSVLPVAAPQPDPVVTAPRQNHREASSTAPAPVPAPVPPARQPAQLATPPAPRVEPPAATPVVPPRAVPQIPPAPLAPVTAQSANRAPLVLDLDLDDTLPPAPAPAPAPAPVTPAERVERVELVSPPSAPEHKPEPEPKTELIAEKPTDEVIPPVITAASQQPEEAGPGVVDEPPQVLEFDLAAASPVGNAQPEVPEVSPAVGQEPEVAPSVAVMPELAATSAPAPQETPAEPPLPPATALPEIDLALPTPPEPVAEKAPESDGRESTPAVASPQIEAAVAEEGIAASLQLPDIELTFPQGCGPDAVDGQPQATTPVVEPGYVEPVAEEAGTLPAIDLTMPAIEPVTMPLPVEPPDAAPQLAAAVSETVEAIDASDVPVQVAGGKEAEIPAAPAPVAVEAATPVVEQVEQALDVVPAVFEAAVQTPSAEEQTVGVDTLVAHPIQAAVEAVPEVVPAVAPPSAPVASVVEPPKEAVVRRPARPWTPPWEHLAAGHQALIDQNIENCRQLARTLLQRELDFNEDAVHWLDEMAEFMHKTGAKTDNLGPVHVLASFLGECVRRRFGGEWALYKGDLCIRYNQENGVFPISRVIRQIEQGRFGGDSITALYEEQKALLGHEFTPLQRRFSGLFKVRPHFGFFVRVKRGDRQAWAKVREIEGAWVYLETQPAPGQVFPPEISVRLCELSEFNVVDTNGVKVKLSSSK